MSLPRLLVVSVIVLGSSRFSAAEPPTPKDHAEKMAQGLRLFRDEVRELLVAHCLPCHGGKETEGGLDLSTRTGLLAGGEKGKPVVVLGKSAESRLMKLVRGVEEPEMPMDAARLSDQQIERLAAWIDLGSPYDKPLVEAAESPLDWTRRQLAAEERKYWAFLPLTSPTPPTVDETIDGQTWVRNDIDRFVLARLRQQQLRPHGCAEDVTLLRRAHFDLTGLPPSAEEAAAYLRDSSPGKYERLIDRLLESEHFGEKWARHWLDVARFAESHGFEHDYDRPHAYHFRDFVIKAFNQDLPYDQFVGWQIAGDELAPDNPLAMMATGFLGAGVYPTQITANEVERVRYDALDDMVATMGTAMLGLTVGCARCHDHKFDPIPQADYYRLVSTFTKTVRSNIDLALEPAAPETLQRYQQQHAALQARLEQFDREQLPARLTRWEAENPPREAPTWSRLEWVEYKSLGGATMQKLDDGSLLVSGKNPDFDTYELVLTTPLTRITALRLETPAHDSLVRGGPGRAANGNFALSDLNAVAAPLAGEMPPAPMSFSAAQATFDRPGYESRLAIDGDKKSAWALDPQLGRDHFAVLQCAEDYGFPGGTRLTLVLRFNNNTGHNIGRLRLSATDAPRPIGLDLAAGPPARIRQALLRPADQRRAEEQQEILQWYKTVDPERLRLAAEVEKHAQTKPQPKLIKVMVASEGFPAIRHHTQGGDFLPETHFLKRGDAAQKVGVATPGFLQVLTRHPDGEQHWRKTPPPQSRTSHQRHALAEWLTDVEHGAGHLLARAIVNRLWSQHFGRGIVAQPNDLGKQSEPPSHPQLLDYLASELIRGQWRLKPIHKQMMLSAVYRQSADADEARAELDPENRWLWRFRPRRLEAELVRDNMLAVSGQLDSTMFGPGSLDPQMRRRSIYFQIKRSQLNPMMQLFDSPEPLGSVGARDSTIIAPQALLLLNAAYVRQYAEAFAQRLVAQPDLERRVRQGFLAAVSREPSEQERGRAVDFLRSQEASYRQDGRAEAEKLALADFCQVLFGLNEFIFVH